MANLTLALDDALLQDARRVAFERKPLLTELNAPHALTYSARHKRRTTGRNRDSLELF